MPASPTPTPTKRKRGGQPGNANALRHGFYSKSFTDAEMGRLDLDIEGEFIDEIALARTNAARLADLLKDYKNMSLDDVVSASNALNHYLDRIREPQPRPAFHVPQSNHHGASSRRTF